MGGWPGHSTGRPECLWSLFCVSWGVLFSSCPCVVTSFVADPWSRVLGAASAYAARARRSTVACQLHRRRSICISRGKAASPHRVRHRRTAGSSLLVSVSCVCFFFLFFWLV